MLSQLDTFGRTFSSDGFVPRRICGLWPDWLVWEHVVGNALIWLAYVTIPLLILYLGHRRSQWTAFVGLIWAFAAFIVLCGLGHFLDMLAFFRPMYRFSGHVLIATGLASWWTVWSLRCAWPVFLTMKGPAELKGIIAERTDDLAQANTRLLESAAHFRQLADSMPQIVWTSRPDGHLDYYNQRWYDYTGLPERSGGEKNWILVVHPDDLQTCRALWFDAIKTGMPYQSEYRFKEGMTGRYRWHLGRALPVRDDEGRIVRWFGTSTDIDDFKRAEEALRENEQRFQALAESIPQLAWTARPDGHIFWYNQRWYDYTGTTPEQMEGWGWQSVHDADVLAEVLEGWKAAIADGSPFEMVFPLRGADGRFRKFLTRVMPTRDADGHVILWFGTNTDIDELKRAEEGLLQSRQELEGRVRERTAELAEANEGLRREVEERRWAEDELRRSEAQFRTLADSIPQLAWMARPDGHIFWYNQRWYDYTGTTLEQMQGWGWQSVHDPDELPRVLETIKASYASGEPWDCTFPLRRHDGVFRWHLSRMLPVKDEAGRVTLWFGSNTDITEQKQLESILREAKEAAEVSTRAKGEFLANMSHEIRTPMNGVIGMTDLLLDTQLNSLQKDYAENIRGSGEALLTVINDILDFSKIEAGKFTLVVADFDLGTLMEEVADLLAPRAQQMGLEINCRIDPRIPRTLRGDPTRIRQVLTNLAGNAVKFTERGEVNLEASLLSEGDDEATLRIEVRDTGIGIPEGRQADIFESFAQVEGGSTRNHGGTGLGLTICRSLVSLMGGTIGLDSLPGEGSTFWFECTFAKRSEGAAVPVASLDVLRVLVVDDRETNRTIFREQLLSWGCRADMAKSGPEALAMLHSTPSEDSYGAILIDHHMPGMDGVETARAVKASPRFARIPLVLCTSLGTPGAGEGLGADLFSTMLSKPIRRLQLYNAFCRAVAVPESSGVRSASTEAEEKDRLSVRLRILLADDNDVNRRVATGMAERLGCRVDAVRNGREAFETLDHDLHDLVLMDVQMPEMDGYAATAAIRKQELTTGRHIPIIAMTANAMQGDREKCLAAGMDGYLAKPLRPGPLREALLCVAKPKGNPTVEAASPQPDEGKSFDPEILHEACGNDPELFSELLASMIESTHEGLARIKAALFAGDGGQVSREAHYLKGAFLKAGAETLAATCQELMSLGDRGQLPAAEVVHGTLLTRWGLFLEESARYQEKKPEPDLVGSPISGLV